MREKWSPPGLLLDRRLDPAEHHPTRPRRQRSTTPLSSATAAPTSKAAFTNAPSALHRGRQRTGLDSFSHCPSFVGSAGNTPTGNDQIPKCPANIDLAGSVACGGIGS